MTNNTANDVTAVNIDDYSHRLMSKQALQKYAAGTTVSDYVEALIQHESGPIGCEGIRNGFAKLREVKTTKKQVSGTTLLLQHNPGRARNEKDHKADIASGRKCFLCPGKANMLEGEHGMTYSSSLLIFCNPYPVLPNHIVGIFPAHAPQSLGALHTPSDGKQSLLESALDLAKDLSRSHFVFYNGQEVGASAPDHAHLQAASKSNVPIFSGFSDSEKTHFNFDPKVDAFMPHGFVRTVVVLQSSDRAVLIEAVREALRCLDDNGSGAEPMLNALFSYEDEAGWTVYIFPRQNFRPRSFDDDNPETALHLSPAALEMAGIVVFARADEFERVRQGTAEELLEAYKDVCLPEEAVIAKLPLATSNR